METLKVKLLARPLTRCTRRGTQTPLPGLLICNVTWLVPAGMVADTNI